MKKEVKNGAPGGIRTRVSAPSSQMEPGSAAREAAILDRTILPELQVILLYSLLKYIFILLILAEG